MTEAFNTHQDEWCYSRILSLRPHYNYNAMQWYEPCLINVVGTMHMSAPLVPVVQLLRGKELETVGLMIGVPVPVGGPTNKYTFKTTLVS